MVLSVAAAEGSGGGRAGSFLRRRLGEGLVEEYDEAKALERRVETGPYAVRVGGRDGLMGVHEVVEHGLRRDVAVGHVAGQFIHRVVPVVIVLLIVVRLFLPPFLELLHDILEGILPLVRGLDKVAPPRPGRTA